MYLDELSIMGTIFSIISICIALYQYQDKKKYQYLIKSNSWMIYQRVNNLGGTVQTTLLDANEANIEKTLYEKIVRSDALAAELHKEAIRLIIISERKVTIEDVDRWKKEGRITEGYSAIFKSFLPDTKL